MTGIYKITNKNNGKVYVGKSKDIMQRWATHERALLKRTHHSLKLQEDFDQQGGIEAFEFSVLELCSAADLNEKEKYYIDKFDSINSGYNGNNANLSKSKEEITFTSKSFRELQSRIGNSYLTTYFYMRFHSDDKNQITVNQSQLADEFGINVQTMSKHIRVLLDNGVIKNIGKSGLYNKYEILI